MPRALISSSYLATFEFARGFGMSTPSPTDLLKTVQDLRTVQGSALIIGGLAVGYHGYERVTQDIDILYSEYDDPKILSRLADNFKIVLKAESGWHHLEHRKTGIRLELIPEGGLTTYGFIPGPRTVGGRDGYISLLGLIWLKLVSGRNKDMTDIIEIAKVNAAELDGLTEKLPSELREQYQNLLEQARTELANDPHRLPKTRKGQATPRASKKPRKKK